MQLGNFQDYVDFTDTVALYPGAGKATFLARMYSMLGLAGEAGELSNRMKKLIRGDYHAMSLGVGSWREQMVGELGGLYWYVARQVREYQQPVELIHEIWQKFEGSKPWQDVESAGAGVLALVVAVGDYCEFPDDKNFRLVLQTMFEVTYGLGFNGDYIISENVRKLTKRKGDNVIKGDGDDR